MGDFVGSYKRRIDFIESKELGIGFNLAANYYFYKQFAISLEANFYLLYNFSKGTINDIQEIFDENAELIDKLEIPRQESIKRFDKQNIFSIGIKYRLK